MRNHVRFIAVSLALSAAGCSLLVDPKAKEPLKTAEGFCNSVQDVFERYIERCEAVDPTFLAQTLQQWRIGCQNLGDRNSAGRFGYDRSLAEQCIASLEQAPCGEGIFDVFSGCSLATPGLVGVGGSCNSSPYGLLTECAGDSRCNSKLTCPGFCEAPGALNQPCSNVATPCASGLVCDSGICHVPGGNGASCGGTYPPCDSRYYYCSTSAPQTCTPYPNTVGANCSTTGYECGGGLYCRYMTSAATYTCQPVPVGPQPLNGDCYNAGDSGCQAGLYCAWPGYTCQQLLPLGSTSVDDSACGQPANTCSMAPTAFSGTCVKTVGVGAACKAGNEECGDGLWCDATLLGATGICRGSSGAGGRCGYPYKLTATDPYAEYADCAPGQYCNTLTGSWAGTCSPYLGAGSPCTESDACGNPWTGLDCMPTGSGTDCRLASCTCTPNACTEAVGWLPF